MNKTACILTILLLLLASSCGILPTESSDLADIAPAPLLPLPTDTEVPAPSAEPTPPATDATDPTSMPEPPEPEPEWLAPVIDAATVDKTGIGVIYVETLCYSSYAIQCDGSLWAWGYNNRSQLGDGTTTNRLSPVKILDDIIAISAGCDYAMAISEDGSLWAWGVNEDYQLGDGTTESRLSPVEVLDDVVSVSAGCSHTLAIKTDGSLWNWGHTGLGQLVYAPTTKKKVAIIIPTKAMDDVVSVSAGWTHTVVIKADGSLWAWGDNSSCQIGDDLTEKVYDPIREAYAPVRTPKKIMDDVASVSAGGAYTMAVKTDGSLWAWGDNFDGQLGDGTTEDRHTPVKIMDDVVSVSAGGVHTMAIRTDGSLWGWGANYDGEIGDGTIENRYYPKKIMVDVRTVSVGIDYTMAIRTDNTLWAWGNNNYGQLGNGTSEKHYYPQKIMGSTITNEIGDG